MCLNTPPPILVIVPCRKGSRRLPGKNQKSVGGVPLIDRTLCCLIDSGLNFRLIVSTDDDYVRERAIALGFSPPFVRPDTLATDIASSVDVALHTLDWVEENEYIPSIVLLLQITSPFRVPKDIVDAVNLLATTPAADAVVGVKEIHVAPQHLFVRSDGTQFLQATMRNSVGSPIVVPNGSIYLIRAQALRSKRTFFPAATLGLTLPPERSLDIDTAEDLAVAEVLHSAMMSTSDRRQLP